MNGLSVSTLRQGTPSPALSASTRTRRKPRASRAGREERRHGLATDPRCAQGGADCAVRYGGLPPADEVHAVVGSAPSPRRRVSRIHAAYLLMSRERGEPAPYFQGLTWPRAHAAYLLCSGRVARPTGCFMRLCAVGVRHRRGSSVFSAC